MILSNEIKEAITNEFNEFYDKQYGSLTKEERKKLGAFYTPASITIQMIEKCDDLNGKILDPCCGSGNILVACVIAGADPNNIYGNEINLEMVELAQKRLAKYGVPSWHIHQGNALCEECLNFSTNYICTEEMLNYEPPKPKKKSKKTSS